MGQRRCPPSANFCATTAGGIDEMTSRKSACPPTPALPHSRARVRVSATLPLGHRAHNSVRPSGYTSHDKNVRPRKIERKFTAASQAQNAGDEDYAIKLWRECLDADPADVAAHCNLGQVFAKRRDGPAAKEHLRRAIALDPSCAMSREPRPACSPGPD